MDLMTGVKEQSDIDSILPFCLKQSKTSFSYSLRKRIKPKKCILCVSMNTGKYLPDEIL